MEASDREYHECDLLLADLEETDLRPMGAPWQRDGDQARLRVTASLQGCTDKEQAELNRRLKALYDLPPTRYPNPEARWWDDLEQHIRGPISHMEGDDVGDMTTEEWISYVGLPGLASAMARRMLSVGIKFLP